MVSEEEEIKDMLKINYLPDMKCFLFLVFFSLLVQKLENQTRKY